MARDAPAGCRSTSRSSSRARRSPARSTSKVGCRQQGPPRGRRGGDQRYGLLRGQPAGDDGRPARADVCPDRRDRPDLDLHSGGFGGNVQNPANALATIIAGLKNDDGSVDVPGFYDEVRDITRPRARGVRPAAARRDRVCRSGLACRSSLASRTSCPWSAWVRGPRSTSTACGAASRERAARRSSPPTPTPRSRAGWSRTWIRCKTFERVRDRVAELAPPGVRVEVTADQCGMWSLTRHRPSGDDGGRRQPARGLRD